MDYNKGMLSNLRGQKEEHLDSKNKVAYATKLMNTYHTIDASAFTEDKKAAIRSELKQELYGLKSRLPKWFASKLTFWIENRVEWMERD